jgi:NAD(P)-dependent dehydrogenase (short-subunit alcohol dehydrogenase family)
MNSEFGSHRTAIVTGGAKRIGCYLVRALAADGWSVLIHCHNSVAEAEALAKDIGDARVVVADLGAADAGERVCAGLAGMPPAGLLVNSASRFVYDSFGSLNAEDWDAHFNANLRGPALLTQAFAAAVPEGQAGLVVNMLDAKLVHPNPDFFSYTISKYGLAALTELSARVLADRRIRVCGIAPSVTMVSGPQSRENFDTVHAANPLRRGVQVEEIASALRFLIATPTITGQTITLDSGLRFLGHPRDIQYMVQK